MTTTNKLRLGFGSDVHPVKPVDVVALAEPFDRAEGAKGNGA